MPFSIILSLLDEWIGLFVETSLANGRFGKPNGIAGCLVMHCPFCRTSETKVIDSRLVAEGDQVRRRRECTSCNERFTTFETAELVMPRVVKSDGSRQPFDEEKLKSGILKALEKRPVGVEETDAAMVRISHNLRAKGEREVSSREVGEEVMNALRDVDEVAYVRFASVYRSFKDLNEFREELDRMQQETEL